MSVISDFQIRARAQGDGLVSPFEEELVNPASYDVRLGSTLLLESVERGWVAYCMKDHGHCKEDPFLLRPGQFVLAESDCVFRLPPTLIGQFMLKSSRAREGIDHHLAGVIDPGYQGRLTLELSNKRQLMAVAIWPGMRIGQVLFSYLASPPLLDYSEVGHYHADDVVTPSRGHFDNEEFLAA